MKLNGIGFENMKVFKEKQWFDFTSITLLTGTNNSGKSSVINAMQLLEENIVSKPKSTIDDLLKTEFRLKANQAKYGSIENFVNKSEKENNNYFKFSRRVGKIEYLVEVNINKGLESYGTVKSIEALDSESKEIVFNIDVKKRYPDFQCNYRINYAYFVNKFITKCKNTVELKKRIPELEKLKNELNSNIENIKVLKEFEKLAAEISNQFSVYIQILRDFPISTDEDNIYYDPTNSIYGFNINETPFDSKNFKIIDEIGVLFRIQEEIGEINLKSQKHLISNNEFDEKFLPIINKSVFNFKKLFGNNQFDLAEFENIISEYYKTDINKCYQLLSADLLSTLSNVNWEMSENYSYILDAFAVPSNLMVEYINCNPDFGLISFLAKTEMYSHEGHSEIFINHVANFYLKATCTLNKNNYKIKELIKSNFFAVVFKKLANYILKNYDFKEGENFESRENNLFEDPRKVIFKDIEDKIINIDLAFSNTYVSSNRFQTKRTYNFNDTSDFTKLLKTIESLNEKNKAACNGFINKWLKEFEIADELVLKPDAETGDFKAYLKIDKQEILLSDFGLGTNQLLPIIFSLCINTYSHKPQDFSDEIIPRTVVIEEPEANLHPAMQSKLADLFADAIKMFKVQIIVETHSEYLIRKLQYLVGTNRSELVPEDVLIYYFYKPDHQAVLNKEVNQVEKIEIDEFGRLSKEFGLGFFDEADRIALDIFLLSQSQSN
jgi:predicted ATPase